jgi:hypothetical protein
VQRPELFDDQEQEDHDRASGILEVLSQVPQAHGAQGSEVTAHSAAFEPRAVILSGAKDRKTGA